MLPVVNSAARDHARIKGPGAVVAALMFVGFAVGVVGLRARPMDVARPIDTPQLPTAISGYLDQPLALSERESGYFKQFGGGVARAQYGPHTLLMVRTTAPLRHLHAPDRQLSHHSIQRQSL